MSTVHVSNISSRTSEKEVKDFFSFCGKISDISVTPSSSEPGSTLSAAVTFERDSAAKTALLLDNTQLGDSAVKVTSASSIEEISGEKGYDHDPETGDIPQEDKPRATVLAEYLSHGYVIGDNVLQKAMELDEKHGLTTKFSSYLQQLDAKIHATDKARAIDNTYNVTDRAQQSYNQGYSVFGKYFESAINTPTGQKVRSFYNTGSKQVLDIHNEALRLKQLRQQQAEPGSSNTAGPAVPVGDGTTKCSCGGSEGVCACAPGKCSCANCSR